MTRNDWRAEYVPVGPVVWIYFIKCFHCRKEAKLDARYRIDATGHVFPDFVCPECGKKEENLRLAHAPPVLDVYN